MTSTPELRVVHADELVKQKVKPRKTLNNIAYFGSLAAMVAYIIGGFIRDPVSPPRFYYEPRAGQVSQYIGKEIKLSAIPLAVFYEPHVSSPNNLEIILRLEDGSPLKAVPGSLSGSMMRNRASNSTNEKNVLDLYNALNQNISHGAGQITLIGKLRGPQFEAYGVIIDGKHYPILKYNPAMMNLL